MKVKLEKIISGLSFVNNIRDAYYNPQTEEVFYSDRDDLSVDELDSLCEESIILPTSYEINEYTMLKKFINTIEDSKISEELTAAINGKGAFKRFKNICNYYKVIESWYEFRDKEYEKIAVKWCQKKYRI